VVVTGYAAITHSLAGPGVYSSVIPAENVRTWRRLVARFKRSAQLEARVRRLERAAGVAAPQDEGHD
jgi:UDP-3-O-[3-hydroxymyristoyl] glucosamine N-acyltransferase